MSKTRQARAKFSKLTGEQSCTFLRDSLLLKSVHCSGRLHVLLFIMIIALWVDGTKEF